MNFDKLKSKINDLAKSLPNKKEQELFINCFFNTIDTTCKFKEDDSVFLITGDIPAMWLRDSSAQVMHYLNFTNIDEVKKLIKGVLKKQFEMILIDGYANAFMENEEQESIYVNQVKTDHLPKIVWERKFELDSLIYPMFLLCKYYEKSKDITIFDDLFYKAFNRIIEIIKIEQNHDELSNYYFSRLNRNEIILPISKTKQLFDKGLIWSGFRPSDDICKYHYHIPDNMFTVSVLFKLGNIFKSILNNIKLSDLCFSLLEEINKGINKYGIINTKEFGKIYASEVDCLGNYSLDDDANIPSLLSIPYLEYPYIDKKIYQNTRNYILSKHNKYYYEGKYLKGIGSPHTPGNKVWPLSLAMQGLTSNNKDEVLSCYHMLIDNDASTNLMHESIDVNNPSIYTRPWFAWANSLFAEFVLKKIINLDF